MHPLYPHTRGKTSVIYSRCGKYIFTTGENMLVRRFLTTSVGDSTQSNEDTASIDLNARTGKCLETSEGNELIVGCDSGDVFSYDTDTCEMKRQLFKTTLPIYSLSTNNTSSKLAITGTDSTCVISLDGSPVTSNMGVKEARAAMFSPVNNKLSVTDLQGDIYITEDGKRLGIVEGLVPSIQDVFDEKSTLGVWSPDGTALACPTKTFQVAILRVSDQLVHKRLEVGNTILKMAFCTGGRYLAVATPNEVVIFDVLKAKRVAVHDVRASCDLAWHPTANELSVVTLKGQLYAVKNAVPENLESVSVPVSLFEEELFVDDDAAALDGDTDADDNDGERRQHTYARASGFNHDDLGLTEDISLPSSPNNDHQDTRSRRLRFQVSNAEVDESRPKRQRIAYSRQSYAVTPFQMGSTPYQGQKKYLCMNNIGYVWTLRQNDEYSTVTTSFFDQGLHRETHFRDTDHFDLAQLSSEATLLANSRRGIVSVRFHSNVTDNWTLKLDLKNVGSINCVALSTNVVVIFTSRGGMRVYSSHGTPLNVVNVHNVITCAAFDDDVFYVQHSSNGYTYTLENLANNTFYQKRDHLELAPNAQLKAVFFSNEGDPFIMDDQNVLSTAVHARTPHQCKFVQVLKSTEELDDERTIWPLGVMENKLLCIILTGQREYPHFPLPVTDELEFKVPGLEGTESEYVLTRNYCLQLEDRIEGIEQLEEDAGDMKEVLEEAILEMDKSLLKQFHAACQAQKLHKAMQITQLIQGAECLHAAVQIASAFNLTDLAESLAELAN